MQFKRPLKSWWVMQTKAYDEGVRIARETMQISVLKSDYIMEILNNANWECARIALESFVRGFNDAVEVGIQE